MSAPLMPKATAVWLVDNTTLTFRQIGKFCELHELEVQAIADGAVGANIVGISPIATGQLTMEEIKRCQADKNAELVGSELEGNVKGLNRKNKRVLSPSQRSDKPAAILWIIHNCPEISDAQICKLVGTTKNTIDSLRNGTHRDMDELEPKNPVAVGLCKEKDLEEAIAVSKRQAELKLAKENAPKKAKKTEKATAKKTTAKAAVKKTVAKKTSAKKATAKKTATKKSVAKKATAEKKTTKKVTVKKADSKKTTAKKTVTKKAAAKKTTKKATAKKTPAE
ncbi:MAG: DUF1013 domain-containing protein [Alphaproteobacteria bacterium]|nr:DUF1013 domain-containing protein [Alphaproteobacteria bacterium]